MLVSLGAISGCATNWQTYPTEGRLNDQVVATDVDSKLARYYLQRQRRGEGGNKEMDATIAEALASISQPIPDKADLRRMSLEYSTDFAALVLAERLHALPGNSQASMIFEKHLSELRADRGQRAPMGDLRIVFAPGWFYRTVPTTGADFWRQRQLLDSHDIGTQLISTGENDTVEENAAVIAQDLANLSKIHPRIVVVSTSKSGPEMLLALSDLASRGQAGAVVAWVNIGGVLRGTPLADWAMNPLARPFVKAFLLGGRSAEGLKSLTTERSEERVGWAKLPKKLLILNYIALPLSGQVSERARQGYAMLRSEGPNDGHTLIVDEILPGSASIVELGLDHYYDDPAIDLKTLALTRTVIDILESEAASKGKHPHHRCSMSY